MSLSRARQDWSFSSSIIILFLYSTFGQLFGHLRTSVESGVGSSHAHKSEVRGGTEEGSNRGTLPAGNPIHMVDRDRPPSRPFVTGGFVAVKMELP
jgi:hypothetical protein